jgi:hypothetical protein
MGPGGSPIKLVNKKIKMRLTGIITFPWAKSVSNDWALLKQPGTAQTSRHW